jgi:thioredoxin 1
VLLATVDGRREALEPPSTRVGTSRRPVMGSKNVQAFNDTNFETDVLKSDVPVLVDFTATWCGPCKALAPIVEKLADDFAGQVRVGKCDIDDSPGTAAKFGVRSVPTVMVFKNGQKIAQHVGLTNRDKLVQLLGV